MSTSQSELGLGLGRNSDREQDGEGVPPYPPNGLGPAVVSKEEIYITKMDNCGQKQEVWDEDEVQNTSSSSS